MPISDSVPLSGGLRTRPLSVYRALAEHLEKRHCLFGRIEHPHRPRIASRWCSRRVETAPRTVQYDMLKSDWLILSVAAAVSILTASIPWLFLIDW